MIKARMFMHLKFEWIHWRYESPQSNKIDHFIQILIFRKQSTESMLYGKIKKEKKKHLNLIELKKIEL